MTERREPAAHPIRDLLSFWDSCYQRHVGARYPFNGGRDSKLVKDLREIYPDDQIRTFMAAFFEMDDDFIVNSGHSLAVFRGCLPKVIAFLHKPRLSSQPQSLPKNLQGIQAWMQKRVAGE